MEEMPLPEDIKERILRKVSNKALALKAFEYIKLVRREDGSLWVKEEFDEVNNHALWFMVLACVNYAQRLLKGEEID
ncbi:MAG: hypothetical protein RMK75_03790 [Aquificaceae bacterium]|nr:hypothetical protein [Aquificaceae bacterium]MDW8423428.1 hypothetical protein [Aquificaceae bacterium]